MLFELKITSPTEMLKLHSLVEGESMKKAGQDVLKFF